MSNNNYCRLCFSSDNFNYMNIFSVVGIEMKMSEIISEHFKCEISESDWLPNFVCRGCWSIIDAFHELYQKSKVMQEKFLNPMIKVEEEDSNEMYVENNERDIFDEQQFDVGSIKMEPSNDVLNEFENKFSDKESGDRDNHVSHEQSIENGEAEEEEVETSPQKSSRRMTAKQKRNEFIKLFTENKHRFDLTCDSCPQLFDTLDDARRHYATNHNNSKGYIKCCSAKLTYRCEVVRHLYRHLEPNRYKCTQCDKVYHAIHALKSHMKVHTETLEKRLLVCDICKKPFTSKVGLKRHLRWHTADGTKSENEQYNRFIAENFDMSCDHCEAVFISFHDARRHYKEIHNEKKGYLKCCNIKLRELWILTDHISSHLNPSNFKCDQCGKVFSSGMRLNQHKGRHRRALERPFICDYCGKSFRDKETITRHLFTTHVSSDPKFECEICHKRFQLPTLLKNHFYSVHRERAKFITCEVCGKSFNVKANFDKHMLSHTDKSERLAQRKQCEHCGEWLMTKSGIYYHEQIHTSGVQQCSQCEMELPHKIALLAHIRKYHRERNHKCSFCSKTFPVSSELKKHEEGHTRHNVYPCQFCTKVFTLRTSRLTHQKRSHREELKHLREMRKLLKHSATSQI